MFNFFIGVGIVTLSLVGCLKETRDFLEAIKIGYRKLVNFLDDLFFRY